MLMSGLKTTIAFQENSVINMNEIIIAPMKEGDVSAVAQIERECFSMPFKEQDLYDYLGNPLWHFLVARENGIVLGYISYMIICDDAEIVNIAVSPSYRARGIGKRLLDSMIKDVKARTASCIHLEVRESNAAAIGLYRLFGFVTVGISKNHYSSPTENALRMNLNL